MGMSDRLHIDMAPTHLVENELPTHYVRVLAYIVGGITVTTGILTKHFDSNLWWLLPVAIFYPLLSHLVTGLLRQKYPIQTNVALIIIDTGICGSTLVLLDFNLIPCMSLLLITSASAMAYCWPRRNPFVPSMGSRVQKRSLYSVAAP